MEESGQPRWFWEPEHAVVASVSSNLTILTKFISHLREGNQILYRLEFIHVLLLKEIIITDVETLLMVGAIFLFYLKSVLLFDQLKI